MPATFLLILYLITIALACSYYTYDYNTKTAVDTISFPHRYFSKIYSFFYTKIFSSTVLELPLFTGLLFYQIATAIYQYFFINDLLYPSNSSLNPIIPFLAAQIFGLILFIFTTSVIPKTLGSTSSKPLTAIAAPLSSIFLLPLLPITKIFHIVYQYLLKKFASKRALTDQYLFKTLDALIKTHTIDERDKVMIRSILKFRERIVREVMVPRVDIVALPLESNCLEAIKLIKKEGYSRLPVYDENIDNITGLIFAKDLLANMEHEFDKKGSEGTKPIKSLVKPSLFIPETQKISVLLRDFQHKQTHFAIIVDEYGGTEGIITLEDILEELVGEIADEYDDEETVGYTTVKEGVWIVDGRMPILDLEEELPISIPKTPDYDTIGGFIIHQTGSIPKKNTLIYQEDFEIKVLKANDRYIEKAQIRLIEN